MLLTLTLNLLLSDFLLPVRCQLTDCLTVGGPDTASKCQFPFNYDGVTWSGCTTANDPDGKAWCSTRTDTQGDHVLGGGHWGHCDLSCAVGCTTQGGQSGVCHSSPTTCVGLDLSKLDQVGKCGQGVCCEQVLSNRIVKIPGETRQSLVAIPNIQLNEVERLLREVEREFQEEEKEENNINLRFGLSNNIPGSSGCPRKKTPAFFHQKFNAPRKEVVVVDKEARKLVKVAQKLTELKNLTSNQVNIGLRSGFNSLTSSAIASRCPWNPQPQCGDFQNRYRTPDGSCNNLRQPNYGRAGTPFQRILLPEYAKSSLDLPRKRSGDSFELPSARMISNRLAGGFSRSDEENSLLLMQMGQFIDHDITHTPNYGSEQGCCKSDGKFPSSFNSEKCFPMRVSRNDPFWRGAITCMEFSRSLSSPSLECGLEAREQVNQITHWLDGSNIYGSTDEEANRLRTFRGGRLKASQSNKLPVCDQQPASGEGIEACDACDGDASGCFFAGDLRVNEQLNLIVVHTVFMREHNRVAGALETNHPDWTDDKLYQEARRITVAEYQHVIYKEWLPIILGNYFMKLYGLRPLSEGFSSDYDDEFDPRINNEFATAAFRFGHSLVPETFFSVHKDRSKQPRVMSLKEVFFQPKAMQSPGMLDGLIRGLTDEQTKASDSNFVEDLRNHLFEVEPNSGGLDLIALNIQRGRDHGLPGYNSYREICMKSKAASWSDLRKSMLPKDIENLKKIYKSIDDIDLFVGGFLEKPHQGSMIGPIFKCIIGDQFARLKKGDRFFYDLGNGKGASPFRPSELQEIRKTSLARLICDNSGVDRVQPFALRMPLSEANAIRDCSEFESIPAMSMNVFQGL